MPRRDGTGPMGQGAMSGRGNGCCNKMSRNNCGRGRNFGMGRCFDTADKDALIKQKAMLEQTLQQINQTLTNN